LHISKVFFKFAYNLKFKDMNSSDKIEQENAYKVIGSNGLQMKNANNEYVYIIASNIKEACQKAKELLGSRYSYCKIKRCYNGGVRG